MENLKASVWRNLRTGTPPKFFSTILCFAALVYNWYFFQNSRFTEIMRHKILIQTLSFLTRLPTRQDGVENRDKVYWPKTLEGAVAQLFCC